MNPISPTNTQYPQIPHGQNNPPANATPTSKYSDWSPFQLLDLFNNSLQSMFMGYGDIFVCAQVCKSWNKFSQKPSIWEQFFKNEGIPFVEKGEKSNYKEEFRVLCPRTINKKMGEKLFGNFPEELPCISRGIFEKFYKNDPFEPGKLMMDTFKITVIPSIIERTSCAEFPYVLDPKGDLLPTDNPTGETLKIPNGIKNLKILCEHPLSGKENMPVFVEFHDAVLKQCNTHPKKVSLWFMRTDIVGKHMFYFAQKAFVKDQGFEVTSLRERVFFDAVCILTSGKCPDAQDPDFSYARTSTAYVDSSNVHHQTGIGLFFSGQGAYTAMNDDGTATGSIGVAPGILVT